MKKGIIVFVSLTCLFIFFAQAAGAPEGTLRVAITSDAAGLNPVAFGLTTNSELMQEQIFESLGSLDPNGNIESRLAVSWKLLDDKTWQFNLRKGVKFHNSSPFTAADVKFTIEWYMDPKKQMAPKRPVYQL